MVDWLQFAETPIGQGDGGEEDFANGFPAPLTSLIGRAEELALGSEMLRDPDVRLVTMSGPPGVGKTRLALALAQECEGYFGDGEAFVPLAPVGDTHLVVPTICRVIGVRETAEAGLLERLRSWLGDRELLLVLDNFEHVASAAPVLAELAGASRGLRILVTSRIRLQLSAERNFPVTPLALPDASNLFCERARAVDPAFTVSDSNASAVAEICRRLDGLPLAIELAASRTKVLGPDAIRDRLEHRLELLTSGPVDLPARQRTLRGTIEWSHELLDADEQMLLRRLAVFIGGCTLEGAEAIAAAAGADASDAVDRVAALIDHNLLRRVDAGPEARLTMLETIREYGLEQLAASGEEGVVRVAHADFCLSLAEAAEPGLMSAESEAWLRRLEREHDNFRSALRFMLDAGEDESALRLAAALSRFWMDRGHLREGSRWCHEALARSDATTPARVKLLLGAAFLEHDLVKFEESKALFDQALRLSKAAEASHGAALALAGLGFIAAKEGDFTSAERMCDEAVALAENSGERWLHAHVGERRGTVLMMAGDYEAAERGFEESLATFKHLGHSREIAFLSASVGVARMLQGDDGGGEKLIDEALPILRDGSSPRYLGQALLYASEARWVHGDLSATRAIYGEALRLLRPLGFVYGILMVLSGLGRVAAADGRPVQAARLFGAAEALAERTAAVTPSFARRGHARGVDAARAALDDAAYTAALDEGRRRTIDEAMDEAAQMAAEPAARGELTARELEILRLVAEQLTNKEIAGRLFLSVRTVHAHLRSIYRKLGVNSRAAAGRRAAELDLI